MMMTNETSMRYFQSNTISWLAAYNSQIKKGLALIEKTIGGTEEIRIRDLRILSVSQRTPKEKNQSMV